MSIQVLGTCHHDCPDSCGWIATVENGRAVKLRGNPEHPYSLGELCPKVNRFLDRVYSPDRITTPLVRSGPKGSGQFAPTSWREATALIAARLHEIIATHGGEAIAPWVDAGTQGLLQQSSLDQRFFAKLGATRQMGSLCGATAGWGLYATNGTARAADPMNVRHAELIFLWGTNTRLTNRHLWPFIEEARANGAKVVVIDPLRTITAESADWFVQPKPGTDVALMLAMMHVIIRDDLVDVQYVAEHTVGFDELAAHVIDWTPERASAICGVAPDEIERLATAYGTTQGTFIRTLIGAEHHEHGAMIFRTMACLPLLTGAWRHRGGGLARSVGAYNSTNIDDSVFSAPHLETQPRRSYNMNHLGRLLTDPDLAPPIKALIVWNGNPAVTVPNAAAIRSGLSRDDLFCIVSEQFVTDTARYADVILPATTQLEQLDVVPSWGSLYLGWNEPAIAPVGESVPNTELWRRLAAAMGFDEPELFESDESLLASALHGIDVDELRGNGFVRHTVDEDLRPFANGGFGFASGKAEFVSSMLVAQGLPALPTYTPASEGVAGGDPRFPLALMSPKQHTRFLNTSYTHLPKHGPAEGGPYVELHPDDAQARGISAGDLVRVFNDRAELRLTARVGTLTGPGVVAVPFGWQGHDHRRDDDHTLGQPATVNSLTSDTLTDWGGGVAYSDTSVEVALA